MIKRASLLLLAVLMPAMLVRSAPIDSDSNGLDDVWEMIFFGALGNDPAADDDGDGQNNLNECISATDPSDAESVLSQEVTAFGPGKGTITWQSVAGKKYHVEFSEDLVDFGSAAAVDWIAGVSVAEVGVGVLCR